MKHADHWLVRVGQKDNRVQHLMTIPGVGKAFALLIVSESMTLAIPSRALGLQILNIG